MKRGRFSEEQIVRILNEHEAGAEDRELALLTLRTYVTSWHLGEWDRSG